ncbi:MAG TPA: hypothetical protein VHB74_16830 [Devosia sp.]|nr:hypothetical protein [Devosia sp.]
MKIKSLLLGSLAVAGLATGANAADLAKGALTSLDVCDALGLSGLTISSDTDCLQISGSVSYQFAWGDYKYGHSGLGIIRTPDDNVRIPLPGDAGSTTGRSNDWDSQVIAYLTAVGTADSDFGPAKVVVTLKSEQYRHSANGFGWYDGDDTGGATTAYHFGGSDGSQKGIFAATTGDWQEGPSGSVIIDKAYVSVGDSTILTAGKTGSVANTDDDTPLNYLGLFNSDNVGTGVLWSVAGGAGGSTYGGTDGSGADIQTGGHSIQVVSSLGNGITLKGGLEDLQDKNPARAGTAVGVISYAGDNLTAHLTLIEAGILDGTSTVTAYHAGFTGTFNNFKLVAAIAGDSTGYYDGLASAQVGLDMFKLAASVEATHNSSSATPFGAAFGAGANGIGYGLSASFAVSDGVSINLGGRYFDGDTSVAGDEGYQVAASLVAAITDTLTLTGEIGVYGSDTIINNNGIAPGSTVFSPISGGAATLSGPGSWYSTGYGAASVAWAPGGGFTSSLKGEVYGNGAYRATFNAAKKFQ